MTKTALWAKLKALHDADPAQYGRYEVEDMCTKFGRRVLRLPPYHSYINPIESFWAIWKLKCRLANMQHCVASKASLSAIERIAKEQFDSIPAEHGQHAFEHCLRVWRHYANNLTVHVVIDDDDGSNGSKQNARNKIDDEDLEELV
jgi:hypothetical protein